MASRSSPCRTAAAVLALFLLPALAPRPCAAEDPLLSNGDFGRRAGDRPAGWATMEGARTGRAETVSRLGLLEGGGVFLEGDATTARWTLLYQRVAVKPGDALRLTFTARAAGLRREGGQRGSCYVGILYRAADGSVSGLDVRDVRTEAWTETTHHVTVPDRAAATDVGLFLSQTGRLEVRRVGLQRLRPADSYDMLAADMDLRYSFFAPHEIDWTTLVARHAEAGRAAEDPAAFIEAITPMLAALEDPHVWIDGPSGPRRQPWEAEEVHPNFEVPQVLERLATWEQVIRNVIAGRTKDGYGYLALGTMQGSPEDLARVDRAWQGMFDAPGLILDLRVNGGGQEAWGQRLCGALVEEQLLYARQRMRGGPAHDDLPVMGERWLQPDRRIDGQYRGPVIALIGPTCMSSGEGMALMLKAIARVTLVGLPTRGASGSPAPVHLPNGVSVWYSRWISLMPDGTSIERRGVPPDVRVEHVEGRDDALDEAIRLLKARVAERAEPGK